VFFRRSPIHIYELENDLYNPVAVPPICDIVLRAHDQASLAQEFLSEEISDPQMKTFWTSLKTGLFQSRIDAKNKDEIL
jgi:hypothetical protein